GRAAYGVPEAEATELPFASPRFRLSHNVMGVFEDEVGRFLAVIANEQRLLKLYAKKLLIAMGSHPSLPAFANNDLPGVYAARAVSRLIRRHRVLPGRRVAVVEEPGEAARLA